MHAFDYAQVYQFPTRVLSHQQSLLSDATNTVSDLPRPNLIYRCRLDELQSVISFDTAQKMRLPHEPASGSRYIVDRLPLRHSDKAATLQLARPHGNPGEKARIINVRAGPLMDRGLPFEHGGA